MKILWITNILFPEAKSLITKYEDLKASGGWMLGLADSIVKQDNIELSVATVSNLVKSQTVLKGKHITYYVIPYGKGNLKYNKAYEPYWQHIYEQCLPDIVHIHGTEYSHGLAFLNACPEAKTVISIQGLTSAVYFYYNYGLSNYEIIKNITFRDILRCDTLFNAKRDYKKRGETIEKPMLHKVMHIIGRTYWDKAHAWAINPKATYHVCNETLRPEFYDGSCWKYDNCSKHTIFLSQAGYPIKGLHQVIKAMPFVLRVFPDTKIRIAGHNITRYATIYDRIRLSGYGKIIRRMIKKYHLEECIEFLGPLNADGMKAEYLNANVFICPSSIENSPNSLGEAQVLGVPCIASYVGGIPDLMKESIQYLYRFEEVEILAQNIIDIFKNSNIIDNSHIQELALQRHHRNKNTEQLLAIYKSIIKKE